MARLTSSCASRLRRTFFSKRWQLFGRTMKDYYYWMESQWTGRSVIDSNDASWINRKQLCATAGFWRDRHFGA